jgi:uncharacterized protein YbjT (DUF2867 family)
MFAITGITGNVGGELARSLLAAIEFESGEAGSRKGEIALRTLLKARARIETAISEKCHE